MKALKKKQVNNLAIDEMRSYIGNKDNDFWLWTVVADRRIKFFEMGKRTEETFYLLEQKLPKYKQVHTDGYHIYENLRNGKRKKFGLTNWNEGLHSRLRDRLKRLQRKTKGIVKTSMH